MKTNPTTEAMNRGEFLRSLGMSSAAMMAFYCMGTTLTSCSKSSSNDPTPTPTPGSTTSIDLTSSTASALKTPGGYIYQGSMIVARVSGGGYVALARACTHQGTNVVYRLSQNDFYCANHGSEFSPAGAVEVGPATQALAVYKTAVSTDGNTLTITA
jgi:cytochrome b6-f complex iron-sulfur subunit